MKVRYDGATANTSFGKTIFEADYALTDDITVRAIKDGPSTYGGEVEMRWKFS